MQLVTDMDGALLIEWCQHSSDGVLILNWCAFEN